MRKTTFYFSSMVLALLTMATSAQALVKSAGEDAWSIYDGFSRFSMDTSKEARRTSIFGAIDDSLKATLPEEVSETITTFAKCSPLKELAFIEELEENPDKYLFLIVHGDVEHGFCYGISPLESEEWSFVPFNKSVRKAIEAKKKKDIPTPGTTGVYIFSLQDLVQQLPELLNLFIRKCPGLTRSLLLSLGCKTDSTSLSYSQIELWRHFASTDHYERRLVEEESSPLSPESPQVAETWEVKLLFDWLSPTLGRLSILHQFFFPKLF